MNQENKKIRNIGLYLSLCLSLFAFPIIVVVVGQRVERNMDLSLRRVLLEKYPEASVQISDISVSAVCNDYQIREKLTICNISDNVEFMKNGAITALIISACLLIAIKIAGKIVEGSRILLLFIFKPGLYLIMVILSFLVILQAILGMMAVYYGGLILIGRIHIFAILGLGIAALWGVLLIIRASFSTIKKATITVLGKKLKKEEQPKIFNFVEDVAKQIGAELPTIILVGLEPNFYVTEANVICLDGKQKGRIMYISLPLCRILEIDEIKTIIAHELAHYKGSDTKFSKKFYPIYRGVMQVLSEMGSYFSKEDSEIIRHVVLMPVFVILTYFINVFAKSENQISRERELLADSEAAKVGGPHNLATALVKVHAFSNVWIAIQQGMQEVFKKNKKLLLNASLFFQEIVYEMEKYEILKNVSEEGFIHPTDSHPSLSQRLKNLNLSPSDIINDVIKTKPKQPAINLFDKIEILEEKLTELEYVWMIKMGQIIN